MIDRTVSRWSLVVSCGIPTCRVLILLGEILIGYFLLAIVCWFLLFCLTWLGMLVYLLAEPTAECGNFESRLWNRSWRCWFLKLGEIMKVVKIVFGLAAGLYALGHGIYLPKLILQDSHISACLGSLSGLCIGAAISFVLFRSAFKNKEIDEGDES